MAFGRCRCVVCGVNGRRSRRTHTGAILIRDSLCQNQAAPEYVLKRVEMHQESAHPTQTMQMDVEKCNNTMARFPFTAV
jgi:hypothetical protein